MGLNRAYNAWRAYVAQYAPGVCIYVLALLAAPALSATESGEQVAPACLAELAAFAAEHDLHFEAERVEFSGRWVAAGHEVRRLPGLTARIPVESCNSVVAVDLDTACRVFKSRGEGACKGRFPLTFH